MFADLHTEAVVGTNNRGDAALKNCEFLSNTLAPSNSSAVIRATADLLGLNLTDNEIDNTHVAVEGCAFPDLTCG